MTVLDISYTQDTPTPRLVEIYNILAVRLGEKIVTRFADRKVALRRVGELVERCAKGATKDKDLQTAPSEPAATGEVKTEATLEEWGGEDAEDITNQKEEEMARKSTAKKRNVATGERRRGHDFNFAKPKGKPAPVREGTKRAKLVQLLSRANGATFEQCKEATGWSDSTCAHGIRCLNTDVGYGVEQDEKGHIKLVG